jgi:hypothetical protein
VRDVVVALAGAAGPPEGPFFVNFVDECRAVALGGRETLRDVFFVSFVFLVVRCRVVALVGERRQKPLPFKPCGYNVVM